jgi:AraC family transcriptional regulator
VSPIGSKTVHKWLEEINLGVMPSSVMSALPQSGVSLLRWQIDRCNSKIHKAYPLENEYRVSFLLAPLSTKIWSDGYLVCSGEVDAGNFRICPPGAVSEWSLESSCDIVNIFLPKQLVQMLYREHSEHGSSNEFASHVGSRSAFDSQAKFVLSARTLKHVDTSYRKDHFVSNIVEQLLYLQTRCSKLASMSCDHLAYSLTAYLVAEYSELIPSPSHHSSQVRYSFFRLNDALEFVENHLYENLMLSQLAAISKMSVSHFTREFSVCFGLTPHRYIMQRRLDVARERLIGTRMAVTDIAMELGFHDASHLSRAFSKHYGASPSVFRRMYAAEEDRQKN